MSELRHVRYFSLLEELGRGGFGTVYRAVAPSGRLVALKVPRDPEAHDHLEALAREGRTLVELEHPNIVKVLDVLPGDANQPPALVMELIEGESLRDRLSREGALPPQHCLGILEGILKGLGHAHKAGLAHGDVKPENVLLADDGRVLLTDFGLARRQPPEGLQHSAMLSTRHGVEEAGTLAYLAPEQRMGASADPKADLFAIGVLLHEMATGRLPEGRDLPSELLGLKEGSPADWRVAVLTIDEIFRSCYTRRQGRARTVKSPLSAIRTWRRRVRARRSAHVTASANEQALICLAIGYWPAVLVAGIVGGGGGFLFALFVGGLGLCLAGHLVHRSRPQRGRRRHPPLVASNLVLGTLLLLGALCLGVMVLADRQPVRAAPPFAQSQKQQAPRSLEQPDGERRRNLVPVTGRFDADKGHKHHRSHTRCQHR